MSPASRGSKEKGWRFEETGKKVDAVCMQSELIGEMKMVIWEVLRDI